MDELFKSALHYADIGIILVDSGLRIHLWNKYIEELSAVKGVDALGRRLGEVCSTFTQERYRDILDSVIIRRQCRFCSSKIHKAFVYPHNRFDESIRQNMSMMPITGDSGLYVMIQIVDISYQVDSVRTLSTLLSQITQGYNDIKESEEVNKRLAVTDPLTGLFNRNALTRSMNNIFSGEGRREDYALMFLDLDGFKTVNDTLGHSAGDKLLVKVAERIRLNVRADDVIARFGGDEFVILIRSKSGREGAEAVAKKLAEEISKPTVIGGNAIRITCSIGIEMLREESDPEDVIQKADTAMYESKRNGKNTYTFYEAIR